MSGEIHLPTMKSRAKTRPNATGRSQGGHFLKLSRTVYGSDNYRKLSARAVKLLIDIAVQYRGSNNGDLQASYSLMKKVGWNSSATLNRALRELLYFGFIEMTRQGGLGRCSLFAVTWESIDECDGKLDVRPTRTPSLEFQISKRPFVHQSSCSRRRRGHPN